MGLFESLFLAFLMFIGVVGLIASIISLIGILFFQEDTKHPEIKSLKHVKTNSRKAVVKELNKKRKKQ